MIAFTGLLLATTVGLRLAIGSELVSAEWGPMGRGDGRRLAHHLERSLHQYEERFEQTHGRLRRCVENAAHRYLDCGIFAQGAAHVHCEECGHDSQGWVG